MRSLFSCAAMAIAVFLVSKASAQTGTICLYADPQGTQCNISDTVPGLLSVYVILSSGTSGLIGAAGVQFAAPKPACMMGVTWLTDSSPFPAGSVSGNSQVGVGVTAGTCVALPAHVLTIQYMVSGLSETDCAYEIVRDPARNFIEIATCDIGTAQGAGGATYVNSALPCRCSEPTGPPILAVSPASIDLGTLATWGFFDIWNDGGSTLTWNITETAPWLTVRTTSGTGYNRNRVDVSRSGLPLGDYAADMLVSSNGGSLPIRVSMKVAQALSTDPQHLWFDENDVERTLHVISTSLEPVSWTVSWNRPWITASPTQGVGSGDVLVRVNRSGLTYGTYTGTITVSGENNEIGVGVWMIVATGESPGGTIGVFSDSQAASCNLFDRAPGLMTAYIVHVLTPGAAASQFAAPMSPCMTGATYLGESGPFPVTIGNTQRGVSIGYGACWTAPIHLLSVQYFVMGLSQTCCVYPVVPDTYRGETEIVVVDCINRLVTAEGSHAIINPDASCQCSSVKVEEATWGKIKSMYSDE